MSKSILLTMTAFVAALVITTTATYAKASISVLNDEGMSCSNRDGVGICDFSFTYKYSTNDAGNYYWKYSLNKYKSHWTQSNDDVYHIEIPWVAGKRVNGSVELIYTNTSYGSGYDRVKISERMPYTL